MAILVTPKLANLPDVTLTTPSDGQVLTYDSATDRWVNDSAASGGVTDHGALTGLGDDDHTQYLLANGTRSLTAPLVFAGTNAVMPTPVGSIVFKNNGTTVAKISAEDPSYGGYDDGELVFYTTFNGTLAERFRIGRTGEIVFPSLVYWSGTAGVHAIDMSSDTRTFYQRYGITMYSSLNGDYAYFNRDTDSFIRAASEVTNSVGNALQLKHITTGIPAAGFGTGLLFKAQTSTTADMDAARISAVWSDATHATRKADMVLTAYDTAEREGLRIRGAGAAAAIGFLGATPAVRQAHVADPAGGGTVDAEARSAINAILATLETYGLHAAA